MEVYRKLKRRILSIDDDEGIGALMLRLFEETGRYKVAVETDSFHALEAARQFRPDLILLDINMPGQNGLDIARLLRDEPGLRYSPIILFSGVPSPVAMNRLASLGGSIDYLPKGVPLETIVETADRVLAGRS